VPSLDSESAKGEFFPDTWGSLVVECSCHFVLVFE
jgi:hypothetical protein